VINRTSSVITGVNCLSNLVSLDIESNSAFDIDLEHWPKLQSLRFNWSGTLTHASAATELSVLTVDGWKKRDLEILEAWPNLKVLHVSGGSLHTLLGIEQCPLLHSVTLSNLRSLDKFDAIAKLVDLSYLDIDTCKRLERVDMFASLPSLQTLRLDNVGSIPTLNSLRESRSLEELFFIESTNIEDGITSIVNDMRLSDFGFQNRKHYDFNYNHVRGAKDFISQRDGSRPG
jgi:Leucine-rich repeat (LRR) protein